MTIEVVRIASSTKVRAVEVAPASTERPVVIGGGGLAAKKLDDLTDVEGATAGAVGQVLAKAANGMYSPATLSGTGEPITLSYRHEQIDPATVWLITHGLAFDPAGVEVFDHVGARHYPTVSYPAAGQVRLDFLTPIRGIARLS